MDNFVVVSFTGCRLAAATILVPLSAASQHVGSSATSTHLASTSISFTNELPKELRKPVDDEFLSLSSHLSLTGSSSSSSSSLTMHHSVSAPLLTEDSPISYILPTIVSLTFSDESHGFLCPFLDLLAHRFFVLFFSFYILFLFDSCDRLS